MSPQELKYLTTSLATATKEELILRIYDALIMFSRQAVDRMYKEPGDIEKIHNLLRRSQRACIELICALDFEIGGQLAQNLMLVYGHWHKQLVKANMEQDPVRIESVLPDFVDYRQTWTEAIRRWRMEQAREGPSDREFASIA